MLWKYFIILSELTNIDCVMYTLIFDTHFFSQLSSRHKHQGQNDYNAIVSSYMH